MKQKTNKKSMLLVLLALAMMMTVVLGTIAWLTDEDTVTNTFTIGAVDEPEVGPAVTPIPQPDPENPEDVTPPVVTPTPDPDSEDPTTTPKPYDPTKDAYIHEPYWEDLTEIVPGTNYSKDPYVGVGGDSIGSYVFVDVKNEFLNNSVYFKLNTGWTAIEANSITIDNETYYTGGLFAYGSSAKKLTILEGKEDSEGKIQDAWTSTPVFSYVTVSDSADFNSLSGGKEYNPDDSSSADNVADATNTIVVKAFIHQAKDGSNREVPVDTAIDAAKNAFGYTTTANN